MYIMVVGEKREKEQRSFKMMISRGHHQEYNNCNQYKNKTTTVSFETVEVEFSQITQNNLKIKIF